MGALAWIAGLLTAAGFAMAGAAKLAGLPRLRETANHLGIPWRSYQFIGSAEICGAVALVLGLPIDTLTPLAIVAAVGLGIVGVGALTTHLRRGDGPDEYTPAVILTVTSALAAIALSLR